MKKTIIIGVIVWIISLGLTFTVYKLTNKEVKEKEEIKTEEKKEEKKEYATSKYYDRYSTNPIDIKFIDVYVDKKNDISSDYFVIDGLKDDKVEDKINKKIKEVFENSYSKVKGKKDAKVETYIEGNFGNILSIGMNAWYTEKDESIYSFTYLNIDLNTGDEIDAKELFVSEDKISAPLSTAIMEMLISDIAYSNHYAGKKYSDKYYTTLEEETLKYLNLFKKGEYQYYIENDGLYFEFDKGIAKVGMRDNSYALCIHSRFLNPDIFDGKYKAIDNLMVFGKNNDMIEYSIFEENDKTVLYAPLYYLTYDDEAGKLPDSVINAFKANVTVYKGNVANNNFVATYASGVVETGDYYDVLTIQPQVFTLDKKYYPNGFWKALADDLTAARGAFFTESFLRADKKNILSVKNDINYIAIDKNGKILTFGDAIKKIKNLKQAMDSYFRNELIDKDFDSSVVDAEIDADNYTCELKKNKVYCYLDNYKDFSAEFGDEILYSIRDEIL